MALFDKMKDLGAKGLDMAKEAGETGKLKLQIASTESSMRDVYLEIGKKLVAEHADQAKELFGDSVAKLEELQATIEKINEQLAALKEKGEVVAETLKKE